MSKRARQCIGIPAALTAYCLVREGAHLLYAPFTLFGNMGCMVLLLASFLFLSGWTLGCIEYMACFIGINVILCGCKHLQLWKTGTARLAAV